MLQNIKNLAFGGIVGLCLCVLFITAFNVVYDGNVEAQTGITKISGVSATATPAPTATPGPTPFNTPTPAPTATVLPTATPFPTTVALLQNANTWNGGAQQWNDPQNLFYGQTYWGDVAPGGNAANNYIARETTQTPDSFTFGLSSTSLSLVIKRTTEVQNGNDLQNGFCGSSACTYPTINLFSNTTNTAHWLSLFHNSVNARIATGTGGLILPGAIHTVGTAPAVSNTSANSCGTSAATIAGTDTTGIVTVGATSGTSCTITFVVAAPTRRQCTCNNETTANLCRGIYLTTGTSKLDGTFVAGDVVSYTCFSY